MSFDPDLVGKGLGARLTDIEAAMARLGSFAFSVDEPGVEAGGDEQDRVDAARALVLRALAVLSDAVNFRLVRALAEGDASLADLASVSGLPRAGLWERLGDLVQVGLVSRSLEGDRAGLTPAGQALVELVEELAASAAAGSNP